MPEDTGADAPLSPGDLSVSRYHVDLSTRSVRYEHFACSDLEDALGGIARSYKLLWDHDVDDPYDPAAPLVLNIGLLSGSRVMTGLRTFLTGFSPLKASRSGISSLMWSAGSGHFGTKLRGLGIDDIVLTGRGEQPTLIHIVPSDDPEGPNGPALFEFLDGSDLCGLGINDRIQRLHTRYPEAHFAAIGPAGEHPGSVRYAAVGLSTDSQLTSGHAKHRFCGRGGFGGVLGSKNVMAIAADGPNPRGARGLREVNREIGSGSASLPYREDGGGGTWRMVKIQHDVGTLPEYNFFPPGKGEAASIVRAAVEEGPFQVGIEGCYLCGVHCHKYVYDELPDGGKGEFRARVEYEPIVLLGSNLGIFDPDAVLRLMELADDLGMDAISLGVTLGYAMEYNRHHGGDLAGGLGFGDADRTAAVIADIALGRLPELGQGVMRLAEQTGDTDYAQHSKAVEYPAYLPQTNPAYPWALAGGHMSMRTSVLAIVERDTGIDYWVDAVVNRGPQIMLHDITGLCKFAIVDADFQARAIRTATGLGVTGTDLTGVVDRTYLRGYANERRRGYVVDDYTVPEITFAPVPGSSLPHFVTPEFFSALQSRVLAILDERLADADL
jgi:aldehyde:ferredoxin oxidoreductase